MIASAAGANVVAVDISEQALALARQLGAVATVNANQEAEVVESVVEITQGGAHVSLDALGHPTTCFNSISNLRKRGKHVQVGLMLADHSTPAIPMSKVIANELEILGSHGMQAHRYDAMLAMIQSGKLAPEKLIGRRITLEESVQALINMDKFEGVGSPSSRNSDKRGLLITHQVSITALTGGGVSSGEMVVVRPQEDSFTVVGRLSVPSR